MNRLIALQAETVIVADDHPLFRTAIKEALEAEQGETNFLEANSFDSLQKLVDEQKEVDLVLLDLHMPGVSGLPGWSTCANAIPACQWSSYPPTRTRW